jgi:hypothetical protein
MYFLLFVMHWRFVNTTFFFYLLCGLEWARVRVASAITMFTGHIVIHVFFIVVFSGHRGSGYTANASPEQEDDILRGSIYRDAFEY